MPTPLMGFSLQSLIPPVQPYTVSGAAPLLTLGPRAKSQTANTGSRYDHPKVTASAKIDRNRDPQSIPCLQGLAPYESP